MYKVFLIVVTMALITVLNGCAAVPVYNIVSTGDIFSILLLNGAQLLVGIVLMYYSWTEAKKQNRNHWLWLILTFFFGLLSAAILILFLKKVPSHDTTQ